MYRSGFDLLSEISHDDTAKPLVKALNRKDSENCTSESAI